MPSGREGSGVARTWVAACRRPSLPRVAQAMRLSAPPLTVGPIDSGGTDAPARLVVRRPGFESADDVVEQGAAADREGAQERGVSGQPPPLLRAGQGTGQGGSGELGERVLGRGEGGEEPDDAGRCRQ